MTYYSTGRVDWRVIDARLDAHWKLSTWGIADGGYHTLQQLLGLANIDHMTEEHIRVCELLCGSHGWTVYKMLKAKIKDSQRERRLKRKHD